MSQLHKITENLNVAQREAVTADLSHLLVLAGAGSGKTRVLVHRIAYLMEAHNVSPYEILAVTFTNKAANEMRNRIEKLRGASIQHMWVGTFHGLAHRLLRTHHEEASLPKTFQIIDSDDQLRLIKRVHRTMNLDEKKWEPKKSQWFINHHKENGRRTEQLRIDPNDYTSDQLHRIYVAYEQLCKQSGLVDFTELLLRSYELLKNHEAVRTHYQKRFSHILVDEFQDTNEIQYRWLCAISGKNSFMMAVGDDDQSIYSWRGAQVKNIHTFTRDFINAQTVRLEQNYRSTKNILDAANAVIEKNKDRLGKTLWTSGKSGDAISLFEAFNEREEAMYVVETIKSLSRNDYGLNDFAILYRSNAQSRVLEEALLQAKIPYRIFGGFRFFERAEIKDALSYLRLLVNPKDDAALERVINTPARGIGQTTLAKIRELSASQHCSLWETILRSIDESYFSGKTHAALSGFVDLIKTMQKETLSLNLSNVIDIVLVKSGLLNDDHSRSEKELSRIENLKELISATSEYVVKSEHENLSVIEAFLADVALETGEQQADQQTDCVSLMTLHAAKGLEFPVVFIVGMEEHLFPHMMSISEQHGLEEERRLCYVGMTRAMQKLFLSNAECRQLHGQMKYHPPSRFISEIPEALVKRVRPKLGVTKHTPYSVENTGYFSKEKPKKTKVIRAALPEYGFAIGQRVTHPTFGTGYVLSFEGQGAHARIQVRFEKHGEKWMALQYARLK